MNLYRSSGIKVDGNNFFGAVAIGIRADHVTKLTLNNNFVGFIRARGFSLDIASCMTIGTGINSGGQTVVTGLVMTNNIAAGCVAYGFNVPGHKCVTSKTQTTFRNNVAHSVGGGKNGIGAAIYPSNSIDSKSETCFEASHFTAYKCV